MFRVRNGNMRKSNSIAPGASLPSYVTSERTHDFSTCSPVFTFEYIHTKVFRNIVHILKIMTRPRKIPGFMILTVSTRNTK